MAVIVAFINHQPHAVPKKVEVPNKENSGKIGTSNIPNSLMSSPTTPIAVNVKKDFVDFTSALSFTFWKTKLTESNQLITSPTPNPTAVERSKDVTSPIN